jgi:hypothetical protein
MNQIATIRQPMKGNVTAIIPQSIEEVFRVSKGVVMSGLAPDALVKGKQADEAAAAVAVAIMSGAELGLKPMVSLRSFTVINGRPALYGDGLINVIRQSGRADKVATGHTKGDMRLLERAGRLPNPLDYPGEERAGIRAQNIELFAGMSADDKECGWCEAVRNDTQEGKTVVFTVTDAKRAGLWSDTAKITKQGRDGPYTKDNDSPWFRYPQRMLAWRAAGWCLRELFGDVLGGIRDEFEAQEIPVDEVQPVIAPPPPEPTETAEEDATNIDPAEPFDAEGFLTNLFVNLEAAKTEEAVMELWDEHDVEATLTGDEEAMQKAFDIRKDRIAAITEFPGDQ